MGYIRAASVVLLLIGSLFPPVGGVNFVTIGAVGCLAFSTLSILRTAPRVHWAVIFSVLVVSPFIFSALYYPPADAYGEDKAASFFTLTLFSMLAVAALRTVGDIEKVARVWVLAAMVLAFFALTGFAGGRAVAFDSNPIWLSRALGTGVLASLWLVWIRGGRKFWHMLAMTFTLSGLLATGSRGPLVGVLVAVMCMVFFNSRHAFKRAVGISALGVTGWVIVLFHPFFAGSRIQTFLQGEQAEDVARIQMWKSSLSALEDHPLGVGFGDWSTATDMYGVFRYPHNIFLEVLVEHGVFIGAFFLALVACVLVRGLRAARVSTSAAFAAALLVAETVNVSVSGDLNARTFFFFLTLTFWMTTRDGLDTIGRGDRMASTIPTVPLDSESARQPVRLKHRDHSVHRRFQ